MDARSGSSRKGCLLGMVLIVVVTLLCLGSIIMLVEEGCMQEARNQLQDYPDSTLIDQTFNGWRAFGIGETVRVISTTDDEGTVRDWYHQGDVERGLAGIIRTGGFAYEYRDFESQADGGTIITLSNECKSDFLFRQY